jgi:hypothetical protein
MEILMSEFVLGFLVGALLVGIAGAFMLCGIYAVALFWIFVEGVLG